MARRALRFERLRAEAAYPRDRHGMRSCLRERLKARIFVRARRQCELVSTGVALASCDPRGVCFRAHGPTHPMDGSQPHRWARRTFLNGKSDDRCEGAPAPPAHICHIFLACPVAVRAAQHPSLMCLCSLCAGDVRHHRPHRCFHRRPRLCLQPRLGGGAWPFACACFLCNVCVPHCRWRVWWDCGRPRAGRKPRGAVFLPAPLALDLGGTAGAAGTLGHALGAV